MRDRYTKLRQVQIPRLVCWALDLYLMHRALEFGSLLPTSTKLVLVILYGGRLRDYSALLENGISLYTDKLIHAGHLTALEIGVGDLTKMHTLVRIFLIGVE